MPPLLSLCVPTYNRAALLSQSLRAIVSQVTPAMASEVEVVVLDNASPDDTPGVVARAQAEFPHVTLRPIRHAENIGCDANFCIAPTLACGEFVYLLSDDDVLLPGAVETLLRLIRASPGIDAFALNVRDFWQSPDEPGAPEAFTLAEDTLFAGRDEALTHLKAHLIFLSCIAFRRENVLGKDYSPRYATNLAQAYMFLDALAPGRGLFATRTSYLARRNDNNEGFDFFRVFVTNLAALLRHALTLGYSAKAVRRFREHNLVFIYQFVLLFKSNGSYGKLTLSYPASLSAIVRLLRVYKLNRFLLLLVIPKLLVPSCIFVPTQRLYLGLKARLKGTPPAPSSGGARRSVR